jgi:Tol biopolymer transport system component
MRVSFEDGAVASALTRRISGCFMTAALSCGLVACGSDADETQVKPATVSELQPSPDPSSSGGAAAEPPSVTDLIVFRSERDQEGIGDLYVMAADGSNVRRLTEGGDFSMPAWALDGQSIAFREVTALDAAIGLIAAEGGEPVRLVTGEDPQLWDRGLAWSGDDITFGSNLAGGYRLWSVSRSGGQRRLLLPEAEGARYAADVSRVDSRIVLVWDPASAGFGETMDLWVADGADDTEPENLTEGRVYAPNAPRWSPDGTRVVFHAYVVLPDGSIEGFGPHDDGLNPPDAELFMIDVRTHELSRLTDNTTDDSAPVWTADGAHVIYASALDGVDEDIWKLAIDGSSDPVNLVDDADQPRADSMPNCSWGVAAPN